MCDINLNILEENNLIDEYKTIMDCNSWLWSNTDLGYVNHIDHLFIRVSNKNSIIVSTTVINTQVTALDDNSVHEGWGGKYCTNLTLLFIKSVTLLI